MAYQPYRAGGGRRQSAALAAMTRGRPGLRQMTAHDVRRQAMKKRRRRRKSRARYSGPTARVLATRRKLQ